MIIFIMTANLDSKLIAQFDVTIICFIIINFNVEVY